MVLILVVLELIRSRRLRERYALLWLLTGVVLLALSVWRSGLNTIAGWVGIETYPPAVLFAVGALFVLLVLLHYSTVISKLHDQNTCSRSGSRCSSSSSGNAARPRAAAARRTQPRRRPQARRSPRAPRSAPASTPG